MLARGKGSVRRDSARSLAFGAASGCLGAGRGAVRRKWIAALKQAAMRNRYLFRRLRYGFPTPSGARGTAVAYADADTRRLQTTLAQR